MRAPIILLSLVVAIGMAQAQSNTISVDIAAGRSASTDPIRAAVTLRAKKIAKLTDFAKRRLMAKYPERQLSFPVRVNLTRNGVTVSSRSPRSPGPITLQFNSAAGTTFPSTYQTQLQNVFNATQAEMTRLFGQPWEAGTILVSNYDATIDDRDAVAGGIYLPNNGSNQQEIRFPLYGSGIGAGFVMDVDTATVNFVHTLLLAYQGTTPYAYDAFEEGLARAVTATIVREPSIQSALGLDSAGVEGILTSSYDVAGSYDWDNQRALGGPVFIAPNLVSNSPTIPVGTEGGAYLLRFRMSGSVWSKVLSEYPLFAAQLNTVVSTTPGLASNVPGLVAAAQTILNADQPGNPTVEGQDFSDWFTQQYILQTNLTVGQKLLVEVVPQAPDPSQTAVPDFGLFDIETTYFATDVSGNETFPSPNGNVSYPIYFDDAFNRFSPTAQDDSMTFFLGYGSVTPNFLSSFLAGQVYRVAIDVPVNNQVQRVFVPAGGVSTSLAPSTNDVYGTVSGEDPPTGDTEELKIFLGSTLVVDGPISHGAFGFNALSQFESAYKIARQVEAQVWLNTPTGNTMILDRFIDKPATGLLPDNSDVGLALDLRVNGTSSYALTLNPGINSIGFPIDPFSSDAPTVLGVPSSNLLVAAYDGISGAYQLNPNVEPFKIGHGYFAMVPSGSLASVPGRSSALTPTSVALEPGWNLISSPLPVATPGTQVLVYHASDLSTPLDFTDASSAGSLIGNTFFSFTPGANDPAAGYPTTGSFTAATQFQPGQAYFVQCLAPEGLVLEFVPASSSSVKVRKLAPRAATGPAWSVHVGLAGSAGDVADCFVGMVTGATSGFDPTLDSRIPPPFGGLQIVSQSSAPLYRDYRGVSSSQAYTLSLSNLIVGKSYQMTFNCLAGNPTRTTLKLPSGITTTVQRNGKFTFKATSPSATFTYTAMGVRG